MSDPADSLIAALGRRPGALWLACAAIIAVSLAAALAAPPTADMGLFLYAAGRVLDGAQLYRDVIEINPPLIVVLNIPVVLLARSTGLPVFPVYRVVTGAALAALLIYSSRLVLRFVFPADRGRGRYVTLLLCFGVFALARIDYGQREHFVLALLLPYVWLIAAEMRGARPGVLEAGGIGVLAGAAVALKPHFALVWLVLEGFRRLRGSAPERWRLPPEMAGTLGFLAAYLLAILLLAPRYLDLAALLAPAYSAYMREPFAHLLVLGPGAPLVWFVLLAALVLRRQARTPQLSALLVCAVVAAFLAGAAQQKEFRYHFYPAMALAFLLLGVQAADASGSAPRASERVYGRAARALLMTIVVVILGWTGLEAVGGAERDRRERAELVDLADAVRAHAGGQPVGVLSYTIESSFPLANFSGVRLAFRFPSLWPLAAAYWDSIRTGGPIHYRAVGEMPPFERYFFHVAREDLLGASPPLLIILRPARDAPGNGLRRLHYVQYFGRDPDLAALLRRYALVAEKGEYLLYQLRDEDSGAGSEAPSAAPAALDAQPPPRLDELRLGSLDQESVVGAGIFLICWVLAVVAGRPARRTG